MKIVFIGTVDFSLHMLKSLIECNVEVVGVVTDKDCGINSDYADLVPTCEEYKIPYLLTNNVNKQESVDWIAALTPEVIFCLGWSRLINNNLLNLPPLGVIGFHPTALPKNRGRHPLIWALVLGLKKTASTFFFMDEGADSGDILSQQEIIISDDDDAQSLYRKMSETAKKQLLDIVPDLSKGQYQRTQQDHLRANVWRKRGIRDGEIDWRMSAKQIHNLVRGLAHPYIGAHFLIEDHEYKVWRTETIDCQGINNIEPGKVVDIDDRGIATLKCTDGCVKLLEVKPALSVSVGDYL
ncbi:MAG: formyl transferase [Candidatus Marinimicrobia bacterium]|jgi:methionyl-tRNA formyltransferase|nr:formyl transferase [Candidatus Neomarinimicrobiota bacterium]